MTEPGESVSLHFARPSMVYVPANLVHSLDP